VRSHPPAYGHSHVGNLTERYEMQCHDAGNAAHCTIVTLASSLPEVLKGRGTDLVGKISFRRAHQM
jgi:hypothetical protein